MNLETTGHLDIRHEYLSLPVVARISFGAGRSLFCEFGPELGYLVGTHAIDCTRYEGSSANGAQNDLPPTRS